MSLLRDDFPTSVKEVLAKRAGQRCSNPDCQAGTSGPHSDEQKAINLGVAAHISAAAPGGPRYNANLAPDERGGIGNAIWLCQNCAKLVDSDVGAYPDARLIMWKRRHEEVVKAQLVGTSRKEISSRVPGLLKIAAIYTHSTADDLSCVLDIRVSNHGGSDLMINAVEFQVLESVHKMPMGQAGYSALYDLDISGLSEFTSHAECQVAQILKPGEADRFGILLSAPKSGLAAGWRLSTLFKTNFDPTPGPDIELWVPGQKGNATFASITQHFIAQLNLTAAHFPGAHPSQLIRVERGEVAGFRSFFSSSTHVIWYCGPKPLIEASS